MSRMSRIAPKFLALLSKIYNRLLEKLNVRPTNLFFGLTFISLKVLGLLRTFLDVNILECFGCCKKHRTSCHMTKGTGFCR